MDDYQLIRSNLELSGRSAEFAKSWVHRWYILAYCFTPAPLMLLLSRNFDNASLLSLSGQFALAIGTYLALFQLRRKPLLNPIQSVVFLFHWWFAIGPGLAVLFAVLRNDDVMLSNYVASGGEALWIVALGLPWYAFCATGTIRFIRGRIRPIAFLMPKGVLYRPRTLYAYWLLGGIITLVIVGLAQLGIVGNRAINYLGGTVSENPFVSALEAISAIAFFATVGIMGYLVGPVQEHSFKFKLIAISLIVFNTVIGFTSGSKGAIVISFAYLFIIMFVWRQKISILLVLVVPIFYLFIVEPFVSQMRFAAEVAKVATPEERAELAKLGLRERLWTYNISMLDVNIESPFRWIFIYADRIASDSSMFSGPWNGTLSEGLLTLVPRAIYPAKPDSNMGNYFARYLGVSAADNYINNIGVSLPFEFVGNYGYLNGILSFGFIGVLWTLFCVWLLSEDRLATHPLSPMIIVYSLGMEASLGQFLARFRDLILVFGVAYVLWILLKKRL